MSLSTAAGLQLGSGQVETGSEQDNGQAAAWHDSLVQAERGRMMIEMAQVHIFMTG